MKALHWSSNDSLCEICGVSFNLLSEIAEMYDPYSDDGSIICHVRCGEDNGLDIERMVHPVAADTSVSN
jgi:hypothetical protein